VSVACHCPVLASHSLYLLALYPLARHFLLSLSQCVSDAYVSGSWVKRRVVVVVMQLVQTAPQR